MKTHKIGKRINEADQTADLLSRMVLGNISKGETDKETIKTDFVGAIKNPVDKNLDKSLDYLLGKKWIEDKDGKYTVTTLGKQAIDDFNEAVNEAKSPEEVKADREAMVTKLTDNLPKINDRKANAAKGGDKLGVQIADLDLKITQFKIQKIKLQIERSAAALTA